MKTQHSERDTVVHTSLTYTECSSLCQGPCPTDKEEKRQLHFGNPLSRQMLQVVCPLESCSSVRTAQKHQNNYYSIGLLEEDRYPQEQPETKMTTVVMPFAIADSAVSRMMIPSDPLSDIYSHSTVQPC